MAAGCAPAPPPTVPAPPPPAFDWRLPPGFPVPAVPPGSAMTAVREELGRHLFYDRRLSGDSTYACASCHQQRLAFTDGRARALGATGELHRRSAMSLANVAYSPALDWAEPGRRQLEEQMLRPLLATNPVEMGAAGREAEIEARLAADPLYRRLYAAGFDGRPPGLDDARRAIGAFVRTLVSGGSAYDRLLFADDRAAMPESAVRGMRLFFSERIGCAGCHGGLNLGGPMAVAGEPAPVAEFHNTGLYNLDGAGAYPATDRGLAEHTGRPEDVGRFRAPTLRNVALTAPYMHDGSVPTLEAVIDHYAAGGRNLGPDGRRAAAPSPLRSERLRGFAISAGERRDLIAFLDSLTDRGFVEDPRFADPFPPGRRAVTPPPG
jgi:cytochrome c peroxidase